MRTVEVGSSETDGARSDDDEIIIRRHCGGHEYCKRDKRQVLYKLIGHVYISQLGRFPKTI